jgi:CheY-like chemotaxis protein
VAPSKKDQMTATSSSRGKQSRIGHVLVVEDDPLLAMALEDALKEGGVARVTTCPTVACSMEVLEREKPDAIVLDVHLADVEDGWALAELLPQLGLRNVQVLFSTGSPEMIPEHIAALGPVFKKPYDPAQLVEAICAPAKPGLFARLRGALG